MKYVLSLILVCAVLLFVDQEPTAQLSVKSGVILSDSTSSNAIALTNGNTAEIGMVKQAAFKVVE